jgi:hypothetical protein
VLEISLIAVAGQIFVGKQTKDIILRRSDAKASWRGEIHMSLCSCWVDKIFFISQKFLPVFDSFTPSEEIIKAIKIEDTGASMARHPSASIRGAGSALCGLSGEGILST